MIITSEMIEQAIGKFAHTGDSVAEQVKLALINTTKDSLCARTVREIFKQNTDKKATLEQTIAQALSVGIAIGMHVQGYEVVDGNFRRINER